MGKAVKPTEQDVEEFKQQIGPIENFAVLQESVVVKDVDFGIRVIDRHKPQAVNSVSDVHVGYYVDAKLNGDDIKIFACKTPPPEIKEDLYYPVLEWRLTMDTLDLQDFWPQWKSLPLLINNRLKYYRGRVVTCYYFVVICTRDMPEDDDGKYFTDEPYEYPDLVKASSIGLPVVKGSDIQTLINFNKGYSIGASRRRVDA